MNEKRRLILEKLRNLYKQSIRYVSPVKPSRVEIGKKNWKKKSNES